VASQRRHPQAAPPQCRRQVGVGGIRGPGYGEVKPCFGGKPPVAGGQELVECLPHQPVPLRVAAPGPPQVLVQVAVDDEVSEGFLGRGRRALFGTGGGRTGSASNGPRRTSPTWQTRQVDRLWWSRTASLSWGCRGSSIVGVGPDRA
jgi:hypothetical protein